MERPEATVYPTAEDIRAQRAEIISQIKGQEEVLAAIELLPEVFQLFNITSLTSDDVEIIYGIATGISSESDGYHRLVKDMGNGDSYDKGQLEITLRNGRLLLDHYAGHLRNLGNDGQQE